MKRNFARGFTLVELLIVIALLGTIATIVIAAINPIEQANKARDAKYTADASQLISAIERYYASNSQFPWQVVDPTAYDSASVEFPLVNASDPNVGLCGTTSCSSGTLGPLITSDELKNEFLSRDFITQKASADITKKLWIGKGGTSSSSVYACFTPLAKSTKDTAIANGKVVNLTSAFTTAGIPTYTTACTTAAATGWADKSCGICIPQ